jgi:hypothetical protein
LILIVSSEDNVALTRAERFGNKARILVGFEGVDYPVKADTQRCADSAVGHPLTVQADDQCFFGGFHVRHENWQAELINGDANVIGICQKSLLPNYSP